MGNGTLLTETGMTSIADGAERGQVAQRAWMHRQGEYWTLAHRDTVVHLRDGKGLHYLAALILHPDVEVHATDLVTAAPGGRLAKAPQAGRGRSAAAVAELDSTGGLGDAGAVLDDAAKRAYRERLAELRSEVDEAESFNDPERAARRRGELEFLQRELAAAVGLGGRDRRSASSAERARVNVTRALKATVRKIGGQAPTLGRYLELGVKTGIFCSFHPPPGFEIAIGEPEAPAAAGGPPPAPAPAPDPAAPHAAAAGPASSRALRTFVFVEIAGALELAARLGDEEWAQLLAGHDAAVVAQARRFGGHAGGRLGEQTLVVFDAPASGVLFAEALVLDARAAGHALRAGVHTGECELLGDAFVGIAVHAAARVSSLARPGEVLVSSIVRDLVAGSDLELTDRGVHALRGVTREWRLYGLRMQDPVPAARTPARRSEAPAAIPLPPRLRAAAERPLFGREHELARLRAAYERAREGGRPFVLLAGEPGIGKSRLAAEAATLAHADGATVLHGRCDADLGLPYQAFAGALGHYVQHAPPALADRLRASGGGALARLVPQLSDSAAPGAPDADRHVLFAEVAALLATNPWPPLVLVLDDLHWADRPTLALLRYLFGAPALGHLLVVGTYRSTEVGDDHALAHLLAELDSDVDGERLELGGLSQADILALTAQVVGRELPPGLLELARVLTLETRGNAFFLTEILHHLADSGELERDGSAWERRGEAPAIELPGNVLETIARRVTRLGAEAGDLLAIAATIGAEFDVGVLSRAARVSEDQALDLLDRAIAAGLVTAPADTGRSYRFAHALVGHTVYQRLPPGRRRRLHRRVAGAIEDLTGGDGGPGRIAELANHVIRGAYAEDLPKALLYARRAGDRALEQLAPQEGERWYERALGLLGDLPVADDAQRCDLLVGLGRAQCQSGNAAFRQTLLDAAEIARRLGDRDRLVEAALANTRGFASATGEVDAERVDVLEGALAAVGEQDSAVRARLLATLAAELTFAGDWERRRRLSDEALGAARGAGDPATLAHVLSTRFLAIWTPETLAGRYAETEEELELAKRSGDRLARFRALHWRAAACVERGELEQAAQLVTRESKLAAELGQPTASWLAAYDRATRALMRGLLDEAETQTETAGRIARESGQPEALAFYVGQLLNVRFEQGRLSELEPMIAAQVQANPGIPAFRAALALAYSESGKETDARDLLDADGSAAFVALPYDSNWLVGLAIYAEACGQVGSRIAARSLYLLLEPWAGQVAFNSATTWGSIERHLGNLAAVFGRAEEAEQRLRRAAELHERMGAPIWLARTRLDLARVLRPGRREERERRWLLEQAMSTARELGCATIERRAAALIEEEPE